jgi:hypothetical protein
LEMRMPWEIMRVGWPVGRREVISRTVGGGYGCREKWWY